ncbi:olfactory receptor 1L3-like [Rhynchonycteris naso]
MEVLNVTRLPEFILLRLSSLPEDQKPLFVLFLTIYLLTLMGNLLIILAIRSDPQLQNPMYFLLSFLSFADICYTTVVVPKILTNFLSDTETISYAECLTQVYFIHAFENMDSYLLAAMAIDHYAAICNPFHYVTAMNHRCCMLLLVFSVALPCLHALLHVLLMHQLTFCESNVIHHFFCDINPVLKLACSSTSVGELGLMTEGLASVVTPLACIVISYLRILITVLRIPSAAGKRKALSTCISHLTVVPLFYGSIISVCFRGLSSYTVKDRIATIIYAVLTSMLNPFIYTLRNKDMKRSLGKLQGRIKSEMNRLSPTKSIKIHKP